MQFFVSGQQVATYMVYDLVENRELIIYTVSTVFWLAFDGCNFDTETNTLTVTTIDGLTHNFELASGHLIRTTRPCNLFKEVAIISGIVVIGLIGGRVVALCGKYSPSKGA